MCLNEETRVYLMKKTLIILMVGSTWLPGALLAQSEPPAAPPARILREPPAASAHAAHSQGEQADKPKSELARFNLDFPGGVPADLVAAIVEANGKPLNVVIPEEHASVHIPALKMRQVTVPELFEAVGMASQKTVAYVTGTYFGGVNGRASSQYQQSVTAYGFKTAGPPREDSIWYFYNQVPPKPPAELEENGTICRFFQLAPYLQTYKIDDITTALETGWKMLGQGKPPKLSFHKDTKLLIAVGEPEKLKMIDAVLEQLPLKEAPPAAAEKKEPTPAKSGEPKRP